MVTALDERGAAVQAWSAQEAAAIADLTRRAQAAADPMWTEFVDWYAASSVAQAVTHTLAVLQPARSDAGSIGGHFIDEVLAVLGKGAKPVRNVTLPKARLGADLEKVYSRPATTYRMTFALSGDNQKAFDAALLRLNRMVEDDLMLAQRDGEQSRMQVRGVTHYRRIIHPELAKSGETCGLCIAAAHKVYTIEDLRPVHGRCNCSSAPIENGFDPKVVNDHDLATVYEAADSNKAADLKRTRFKVNEHGELGPVLTDAGDHFQGPGDPDHVDLLARDKRQLEAATAVMKQLHAEGNTKAIPFQQHLIDKLRGRITAAA